MHKPVPVSVQIVLLVFIVGIIGILSEPVLFPHDLPMLEDHSITLSPLPTPSSADIANASESDAGPFRLGERYADNQYGYSIIAPDGWVRLATTDEGISSGIAFENTSRHLAGSYQGRDAYYVGYIFVGATLPSTMNDPKAELDGYVGSILSLWYDSYPTFKLEERKDLAVGPFPATRISGTFENDDGAFIRVVSLHVVKEGRIYEVVATAAVQKWEAYGPLFDSVLGSLVLTPSPSAS